MTRLLYGSGLRLLECLRLRVKDFDFPRRQMTIRERTSPAGRPVRRFDTALAYALYGLIPLREPECQECGSLAPALRSCRTCQTMMRMLHVTLNGAAGGGKGLDWSPRFFAALRMTACGVSNIVWYRSAITLCGEHHQRRIDAVLLPRIVPG